MSALTKTGLIQAAATHIAQDQNPKRVRRMEVLETMERALAEAARKAGVTILAKRPKPRRR
jgi:hypothetical protein